MMNNLLKRLPLIMLASILLVAFLSLIGGVYEWNVRSLVSSDGLRWSVSHIVSNIGMARLQYVVFALIGLGVFVESGLPAVVRGHRSLKQRRAFMLTLLVVIVYVLLVLGMILFRGGPLLSAVGTVAHSSFLKGLPEMAVLLMIIAGNVYGYTSGRFVSLADTIDAHVALLRSMAPYFLTLVIASELVGCIRYVCAVSSEVSDIYMTVFEYVVYYLPLILHLFVFFRSGRNKYYA